MSDKSEKSPKPFPAEYRINGRVFKPHPAANCFPLLTGTPFSDLIDDIRTNGMVMPVFVLQDYVLDGRNRLLAADQIGLTKIPTRQLPDDTDAVAFVASLNIHRRHLTANQRSAAAAELMDLSKRAFLEAFPDEVDPDSLESPLVRDGLADYVPEPAAEKTAARSARSGPTPVTGNGDVSPRNDQPHQEVEPSFTEPASPPAPLPGEESEHHPEPVASSDAPLDASADSDLSTAPDPPADLPADPGFVQSLPDLTEEGSPVLSVRKVAESYDVGNASVVRSLDVLRDAPDLHQALKDGILTTRDAHRIRFEPEEVRRQAVEDVVNGVAVTAVRAIRQRYDRDPVPDPDSTDDASSGQPSPLRSSPPGEVTVAPTVLGFVRQLLGEIAFDPCSADWCAEHVAAHDWCGVDTDGLVAEWAGAVWVFPPPELADPFISKALLELESGRVTAAAMLVPMTPWSDPTRLAFGSPHFHGVIVPSSPITCRRPDGKSVCPEHPHWILLLGRILAPAVDVCGSFASTVLVPQRRS